MLYAAAAVIMPTIVPFTLGVMKPTNDMLMTKAGAGGKASDSSSESANVEALLEKWKKMNYVRAFVVGTGALLAATATVLSS